jgi:hypothetical protein
MPCAVRLALCTMRARRVYKYLPGCRFQFVWLPSTQVPPNYRRTMVWSPSGVMVMPPRTIGPIHAPRAIHKSWSCGHGAGGMPSVQRPSGFAVAGLCPWSSRGSPGSRWRVHGLAIPFPVSFGLCSMKDLIQREWSCSFAELLHLRLSLGT